MTLRRDHSTLLLLTTLIACSSEPVHREAARPGSETHPVPQSLAVGAIKVEPKVETKPEEKIDTAASSSPATTAAPQAHAATPAVNPAPAPLPKTPVAAAAPTLNREGETALRWLKNGNIRFRKARRRADGLSADDRKRLSGAEYPHSIILSCSDSRVAPEHIFDQRLGEIYVVRSAGEGLDFATIASVEDAVQRLHSRLLVILGHESCPTVKAALENPDDKNTSPYMKQLLANVRSRIIGSFKEKSSEEYILEADANAAGAATELMNRSEIIKAQVKAGQLSVVSGVYHLESGEVVFTNANATPHAL